jgi:FhaA, N-terminal domain/FHA domain
MARLRKFEKRLEKLFEAPFKKLFKGGVQPLEIARRLVKEVEDGRVLGVNATLAPIFYQVSLGPVDYERLSSYFDRLAPEMEGMIIDYTSEKGYNLTARPQVTFEEREDLGEGEFEISTQLDKPQAAVTTPEVAKRRESEQAFAILSLLSGENAGTSYYLQNRKTSIGRSHENDFIIPDARASRFHAEIERSPQGYILRDLASTNGTLVGGRRVRERLLEDGDEISMGDTDMRFRFSQEPGEENA